MLPFTIIEGFQIVEKMPLRYLTRKIALCLFAFEDSEKAFS